jgi:hypothetical protein
MKYIPLKACKRDDIDAWIKKSNGIIDLLKAEPDSQKRKVIIKKNAKHWRDSELLEFLKLLSNNKCWYTESKFAAEYPQVEHFRPKSCARDENWKLCHEGYWWLAFDIDNYRLSKPMPNVVKGTYFPLKQRRRAALNPTESIDDEDALFIDPSVDEDCQLVAFNRLGLPEPVKEPTVDLNEWDLKRIEFSIRRYRLDDKDLCDLRKALWQSISERFNEYRRLLKKAKDENSKKSAGQAMQVKEELKTFLNNPEQEFTAVVRDCFNSDNVGKRIIMEQVQMLVAA